MIYYQQENMQRLKASFVTTVINEEKSIKFFLNSVFSQTKIIDEIIIVDGGSIDKTVKIIKKFIKEKDNCKFFIKKGNRSVGRNYGIKNAKNNIILISDAGCFLDKSWAENISKPFSGRGVNVVAGYYKGRADTLFQKCLIPYVLVMPDKINHKLFLPSTRSMAINKKIWRKMGGFPEKYSHNEDFVFANKLKQKNVKIIFEKKAIVYWYPRKNIFEAFYMFYRFALGDAESEIFRSKMKLIFLRYLLGFLLLFFSFKLKSTLLLSGFLLLLFLYFIWSISKNYRYVKNWNAFFILPILQLVSDVSVIFGTTIGLIHKFDN